MSRIGNSPILIPAGVVVETGKQSLPSNEGKTVVVTGPKGTLELTVDPAITVTLEESNVVVKRKNDTKKVKSLHGLVRSLIANNITGVTSGWNKDLELVGVGFRAQSNGNKLTLNVGYSHPVDIEAPEGVSFEVLENTKIKVSGIDRQVVGQVAANVKKVRVPDVYKGKGIRYQGEYIRKKLGKTGKIG